MPFCDDVVSDEKFAPSLTYSPLTSEHPEPHSRIQSNDPLAKSNGHSNRATDTPARRPKPNLSITDIPSPVPSTSKLISPLTLSPEDCMREILPSPVKTPMPRKREVVSSSHLTSDEHFEAVKSKKSLFKNDDSLNRIQNRPEPSTSAATPQETVAWKKDSKYNQCGFCLLDYNCEKSVKKGSWIQCQQCETGYHEICVGGRGKRYFKCGKCV